jgi:hypothetical protein
LDNQLDFVDVQSFDCLIQAVRTHHHPHLLSCQQCLQSMTAAIELYQGELLAGLVIDEPEFTNWLRHAADTALSCCHADVEASCRPCFAGTPLGRGPGWAQRHLALQPWAESAHRKLMLCLAARGEQGALRAHYQQFQTTLETELGLAPSPQTVQFFRSLDDVSNLDPLIRLVVAADHPEPLRRLSPPTIQWSAAVTAQLYGFPNWTRLSRDVGRMCTAAPSDRRTKRSSRRSDRDGWCRSDARLAQGWHSNCCRLYRRRLFCFTE